MVGASSTVSTRLQFKLLEQELQENFARAYYLLVAEEISYVNHALSVDSLVSKLQIIASRVEAFNPSKNTSSTADLVSDTRTTQIISEKTERDTCIVNDKDALFLNKGHQPHQYSNTDKELSEFDIPKQNTYQSEGCHFDEEETCIHIADKVPMPMLETRVEAQLANSSLYSCSGTSFGADTHNPSSAVGEVDDNLIHSGNDITTAAATGVSFTVPYSNMENEAKPVEAHSQRKQRPPLPFSTAPFLETIHSLCTGGSRCPEMGDSYVVSGGDSTYLPYSIISNYEHRPLQTTLPDLPFLHTANQPEEAEKRILNTTEMPSVVHRKPYDRALGVFCKDASLSGNVSTGFPTQVLHLPHTEKVEQFAQDAESCGKGTKVSVSLDRACQSRIGNPSHQPEYFFQNYNPTALVPFAAQETWDHVDLRNPSFKGAMVSEPQGVAGSSFLATTLHRTQRRLAIPTHEEGIQRFSTNSKAASEANLGMLNGSSATPEFVFWPGLPISNFFIPITIAARLASVAGNVASTSSLTIPLRESDLTAILEARFPPYLTQLTPDRVRAFYGALRERLLMEPSSFSRGFPSGLLRPAEEKVWTRAGPDLHRQASEVAATLLTLLPPVLQGLQGAASIPLDAFSVSDRVFSDVMDISIEPEERSPRCFDGRGSFDEDRGGPSARRQGSVRVWRRYWCRRLYELLHEARCGLEVVNHFDTLWPRTHHRLMDLQQHNMEFERSCSRNFPFSIPTPSPFSDSTVPVAFKPECTCMAVAVQNSGFDSESCRVFLHDLAAPGCFPSLLSALTENGDDGRGWASGVSNNNSELQMIYIRADISTSEEIPPSCPGWPLPIVYNKDSNDQSVVVKVQMPPRVSADRLQSDLVYLNLFL